MKILIETNVVTLEEITEKLKSLGVERILSIISNGSLSYYHVNTFFLTSARSAIIKFLVKLFTKSLGFMRSKTEHHGFTRG